MLVLLEVSLCIQPPHIRHLVFLMTDRPSTQNKSLRREQEGTSASAMHEFLAEGTLQSRDSDRPHTLSSEPVLRKAAYLVIFLSLLINIPRASLSKETLSVGGELCLEERRHVCRREGHVCRREEHALQEEGAYLQEGEAYLQEGGVCLQEGGAYLQEGGACLQEGGACLQEGGACL